MDPQDQERASLPPVDEEQVFAAAVRQYLAAIHISLDDVASYWTQIQGRVGWPIDVPVSPSPQLFARGRIPTKRTWRRSVWSYALGTALGVLAIVAGWASVTRASRRHAPPVMATYTTTNGQRATITLADGSTVMLNVASRLEVPGDYATGDRAVRLTGEALFTVSHHAGTAFTVQTGPIVTRVLGTSFVVRRYPVDTFSVIAVQDGKVAVGREIVTSNRLVEVGPHGRIRTGSAAMSYFTFARGVLALEQMSLVQAIPELDRWYDADIRLGDPTLATRQIKGYVTAGSLADLTERLTVLFDVRVVREGRTLTLYPR